MNETNNKLTYRGFLHEIPRFQDFYIVIPIFLDVVRWAFEVYFNWYREKQKDYDCKHHYDLGKLVSPYSKHFQTMYTMLGMAVTNNRLLVIKTPAGNRNVET